MPEAGNDHLSDAVAGGKSANFLFDELAQRISRGPIIFRIFVQVAHDGDTVDDATVHWAEDRSLVEFGKITRAEAVPDDAHGQQQIIFDPIPRVEGIEPSADPLLELRAAVYLLSGRRAAG